jgi:prepilin-type N-terminal cleavage/methylation domain-containing protein
MDNTPLHTLRNDLPYAAAAGPENAVRRRLGFTLIELIIAVAIGAVLIVLA